MHVISVVKVEKKAGTIINIGSSTAYEPVPSLPVYSAAKFGLRGWSINCVQVLRKHDIKVTLINPGAAAGGPPHGHHSLHLRSPSAHASSFGASKIAV